MTSALIGCSGLIGGNLLIQRDWTTTFNTKNAHQMKGHYDLILCAAPSGSKWIANLNPEEDRLCCELLIKNLCGLVTDRFVLISTADVFGQPVDSDETDLPRPGCGYGTNRLVFENTVRALFPNTLVVRLPGVIGPGLKKGPIYDLQNEHRLEYLNVNSVFQWYNLENLWRDIKDGPERGVLHLCPPPELLFDTVKRDFPHIDTARLKGLNPPVRYNLKSQRRVFGPGG